MHIVSFKSRCFIFLLQVTGAIFTLSYAADTKVYYHAFPMGQGSSSFVRYHSADGKSDNYHNNKANVFTNYEINLTIK